MGGKKINICQLWKSWFLSLSLVSPHLFPLTYREMFFKHVIASLVAQTVKNLPERQETQVWYLGQEDPLKKKMTTHSSIFARKNSMDRGASRAQSMGSQRVRQDWTINTFTFITCLRNAFCCSCPEATQCPHINASGLLPLIYILRINQLIYGH